MTPCMIKTRMQVIHGLIMFSTNNMNRIMRKSVFGIRSHKPGFTASEHGLRLKTSDLESTDTILHMYLFSEKKGADQLICNRATDMCLCSRIYKEQAFS